MVFEALRNKRLKEASRLKNGDTPEAYQDMLLKLYPQKSQQDVIKGLMAIAKVAMFGCHIMPFYQINKTCPPHIESMFPKNINQHIARERQKGEKFANIILVMDHNHKNRLIRATNLMAYQMREISGVKNCIKQTRNRISTGFSPLILRLDITPLSKASKQLNIYINPTDLQKVWENNI